MGRRSGCVLAALFVAATASAASAQVEPSPQERQAARALADTGLELFEAGKYAEAYDRFRRADIVIHAPPHVLYMARSQAKLGKLLEARTLYERIVAEKLAADAPKPFKQAQEAARAELDALVTKIPAVVVVLPPERAAAAKVTIDGTAVDAPTGAPVRVDPGRHVVRIEESGRPPVERTLEVNLGETARVELDPPAPTAESSSPADDAVEPDTPGAALSPSGLAAIVAFGVGSAGFIAGVVTGALAFSKAGELKDACPKNPCSREHEDLADSSRTFGTISTIGFIAGGVGAAAGVAILVLRPFDEPSPTQTGSRRAPRVGVQAGPAWIGVTGAW